MRQTVRCLFLIGVVLFLFTGCNSLKKSQKAMLSGNYAGAIAQSLKYLQNNPSGNKTDEFVQILRDAYRKANERDKETIHFLFKEKNPEKLEEIFKLYKKLDARQKSIKPILNDNIRSMFSIQDYSDEIIKLKEELSYFLYDKSVKRLQNGQGVMDFRKAYDDLHYLDKINPGYKDVQEKMKEAHFKGTNFVFVKVLNNSDKVIPSRLETDLLDFNTYGINNFWTVYQSEYSRDIDYAYEMILNITKIEVSPEQIKERELVKEKQIKDGYSYLEDELGNLVKDSLGNAIKVDKFVTVRCHIIEISQFKSASVGGDVIYNDMRTKQRIQKYPLSSQFVFEHQFATADGDRRALGSSLLGLLKVSQVPFPSDEKMIYDTGKDLKNKLAAIIQKQQF